MPKAKKSFVDDALTGDALADMADEAMATRHLEEALELFDRAEPTVGDPDRCAGGRWMVHMLRGDFAAAWNESDAIRRRGRPDPHRFWNGEDLAGRRVIVRSLHGYGDAVQMLRFLPHLAAVAGSVVLEVAPRLLPLARCFAGVEEVITWGEGAPLQPPVWDVQLEITELPYALRVTAEHLEMRAGTLRLPAEACQRARAVMLDTPKPRIGLVWSAGEWNPTRSLSFAELEAMLLTVENVSFWSLQGEPARGRWLAAGPRTEVRDAQECGDGLIAMAAAIQQLDLLITVDTLAAHLAGTLAVPCWLLLQHRADWRWMERRDDTPWYATLRLWRQRTEGDWAGLLQEVREALEQWLRKNERTGR